MSIVFHDFIKEVSAHRSEYDAAINRVLESGWFILGKEVEDFEKAFAKYLGVSDCIGVANGLEALQISLMALNIGKGDEVITTPLSAVATTLAILAVGAKPVFVDTDGRGLIDVSLVEAAITPQTKAVLPVHLYGSSVDLEALQKICERHQIFLLEDAAQAHGAEFKGKKLGSLGAINSFSFYPTKNIGAFGDGGALVTNDQDLAKKCRQIRDYGQSQKYVHEVYGLNSRLDELQAAILQVRLKHLDEDNHRRLQIAQKYVQSFKNLSELEMIIPEQWSHSNFHLFVIKTPYRDQLQKYLHQKNIAALIHYPLLIPDQPFLKKKYSKLHLPNAHALVDQILSLPCHPHLTDSEQDLICSEVRHFFENLRK
jgi:dTDP-4-amino-4,6-dideoxygalactose transaminase